MSVGGRAQARDRMLRGAAIAAAILIILTLLLLAGGHWIFAVICGIAAAVAVWVFLQARTVR